MMAPYIAAHTAIRVDPEARSPKHLHVEKSETAWKIRQTLLDPERDDEWFFEAAIDLERSRAAGRPVLALERIAT